MRWVTVVLLLAGLPALAEPIFPETIWELSTHSDRIVVAQVDRLERAAVTQTAVDAIDALLRQRIGTGWVDEAIGLLEFRLGAPPPAPEVGNHKTRNERLVRNLGKEDAEVTLEQVQRRWADLKARFSLKPVRR